MRQARPGDRVLLEGVIESVHDDFVMVTADGAAPHAIPQRYDLVAVRPGALALAPPRVTRLTVEEADRLAQERPPYPPKSDVPAEQCTGPTGWHRPQAEDWNRGNRESTCTWCGQAVSRNFCDPAWRGEMPLSEASRADAALAVIFSNPCACPERHAGTADGTCGAQSGISVVGGGYRYTPMCLPCAACVNSQVPPGRASGSASRRLRTG